VKNTIAKPKLIFFQFRYEENVPYFQVIHKREHVSCLSQYFDVTVISEDCDYQQVCDQYEPDIALFESGLEVFRARRPKVKNIRSNSVTPRVALLNSDGCSELRSGILADIEYWDIETLFSISLVAAEHMPGISRSLFVWPNFIDPAVYFDYGERKLITVLLTGSQSPRYPWRHKVYDLVSRHYPSLLCPHMGYVSEFRRGQMLYGERYARTINASMFAPTCGSVSKELVRKHVEIPGCSACLITERSPALEAAGFVDMVNCVFADESDVLEKLSHLLAHEDELAEITQRGYELVHSRHTMRQRDQLYQWFALNKVRRPDQRIVQTHPFGRMTLVDKLSAVDNCNLISRGMHLVEYERGERLFCKGSYVEAERAYLKCLNYLSEFPEAKLKVCLCNLYKGNASDALSWILQPLRQTLVRYGAVDPDPVEWAYLIICLLCRGKLRGALKRARQFPALGHPELERARWATAFLSAGSCTARVSQHDEQPSRLSIHQFPNQDINKWIENLCAMLEMCRQSDFARTLRSYLRLEGRKLFQRSDIDSAETKILQRWKGRAFRFFGQAASVPVFGKVTLRHLDNPELMSRIRHNSTKFLFNCLRKVEGTNRYFLPYTLSRKREDEFFAALKDVALKEQTDVALMIGVTHGGGHVETFAAGVSEKLSRTSIFCITNTIRRGRGLSMPNMPFSKWYELPLHDRIQLWDGVEELVVTIKKVHHIGSFDFILIKAFGFQPQKFRRRKLLDEISQARIVVFDDTNEPFIYWLYGELLSDTKFVLIAANPSLRNGYAVFKRRSFASGVTFLGEDSGRLTFFVKASAPVQSLHATILSRYEDK
jgi:hypothetical protein